MFVRLKWLVLLVVLLAGCRSVDVNHTQEVMSGDLASAVLAGDASAVRTLIDSGHDVDCRTSDGKTVLMQAAVLGHREVAQLLLDHGADITQVSDEGLRVLDYSVMYSDGPMVHSILSRYPDMPEGKIRTELLCTASQYGNAEAVQVLVEMGAEVDEARDDGLTPLIAAVKEGHSEVVEVLISNEANVEICSEEGWTPLMHAINQEHIDIAVMLIDTGVDVM